MQEHPTMVIDRMNRAYDAVHGTMSSQTRMRAEKEFYWCYDWLRERRVKFRQTPAGNWILDEQEWKTESAQKEQKVSC